MNVKTVDADRGKLATLTSTQLFGEGKALLANARRNVGAAWENIMLMQLILKR